MYFQFVNNKCALHEQNRNEIKKERERHETYKCNDRYLETIFFTIYLTSFYLQCIRQISLRINIFVLYFFLLFSSSQRNYNILKGIYMKLGSFINPTAIKTP